MDTSNSAVVHSVYNAEWNMIMDGMSMKIPRFFLVRFLWLLGFKQLNIWRFLESEYFVKITTKIKF